MPDDPFYKSAAWRQLRAAALERDRHTCTVPHCLAPAIVVDHITSRASGGADVLSNVRSLCRQHDNQCKENALGKRRSGGKMTIKGCFADGSPRDPSHPWFTGDPGSRVKQ